MKDFDSLHIDQQHALKTICDAGLYLPTKSGICALF